MDYICCYFDTQGFYHNNKFYPREIAVLSEAGATVFSVDHGLKLEQLSASDQRQATYLTNHHHGLPFQVKTGTELNKIDGLISTFYDMNIDDDHFLIACRSKEAEEILKSLGIPRLNIGKLGATWSNMLPRLEPCALHKKIGKCSLNAVIGMKKWVEKGPAYQIQQRGQDVCGNMPGNAG